jgi:hypothetical protein
MLSLVSDDATVVDTEKEPTKRTEPMSFAIRPEVKERLADFRKKGGAINVSAICNAAIVAELERADNPEFSDLVARLRLESDRRRGEPYRMGHQEGGRWSKTVGSWAEICFYADLIESDVLILDVTWSTKDKTREWQVPTFKGRFVAPEPDYPRATPHTVGAPNYAESEYANDWITDRDKCDQYWRGWLAGVQEVYRAVSSVLEPIKPLAPGAVPKPTPVDEVDPDDIPF